MPVFTDIWMNRYGIKKITHFLKILVWLSESNTRDPTWVFLNDDGHLYLF